MNFTEKEEFTEVDILRIIESKLEESVNIEFKGAKALSNDKMVKKEISKDISSFANSDGGIIFYGIDEENHVAFKLSYIDGNIFSKEWLENIIISTIQQKIENLKIIPIRFDNDIKKSIYVVKIPKSVFSPHLNGDKKYYKRYNFQSVPMEEYEVRNLYFKERDSEVFIDKIITELKEYSETHLVFKVEVQIVNDGKYVSEKYKIACDVQNALNVNIKFPLELSVTSKNEGGFKISTTKMEPLFPNELLNAMTFELEIPQNKFDEVIERIKFIFCVFSSDNLKQVEMNVPKMLKELKDKTEEKSNSFR